MTTLPTVAADPKEVASSRLPAAQAGPGRFWRHTPELLVLAAWTSVVGFTLNYHEKWADEAQAWLLARDLDLYTLWFKELRYEGSPGLWHTILWVAQHVFHAPYGAIGIIGMVCALAGTAVMLFKAPFPRPLRWLLAFTYFMVYQYAVIARPYTLLPLLAFIAAGLFRDRKRPERMTLVLILMSLLTVHGILIAAGIGCAYLVEAIIGWKSLDETLRRRYLFCLGAMLITFFFLVVILKPTPDIEEFVIKKDPAKYHITETSKLVRLEAVVSGGLMDYAFPSGLFLLFSTVWCFMRRRLLAFAIPTALLIILYTQLHGFAHHHGTVFLSAIVGLWIAWPTEEERQEFTARERSATQGMIAFLVLLFGINIYDAAVAIRNDYRYPYSGAQDAANYLKFIGAVGKPIFGYMYGVAGVQAYFDHNILSNMPTTYYHHGTPLHGRFLNVNEILGSKPEYLIIHSLYPDLEYGRINGVLNSNGYELAHFSDGYLFFKQAVYERQTYFIYRRSAP